jgi:hypothetical protein
LASASGHSCEIGAPPLRPRVPLGVVLDDCNVGRCQYMHRARYGLERTEVLAWSKSWTWRRPEGMGLRYGARNGMGACGCGEKALVGRGR